LPDLFLVLTFIVVAPTFILFKAVGLDPQEFSTRYPHCPVAHVVNGLIGGPLFAGLRLIWRSLSAAEDVSKDPI
jgi:hypothetical protein